MTTIPTAWQTPLGGKALTGMGTLSIIGRNSSGPALFAFDPDDFNMTNVADAQPLIYYDLTGENCVNTVAGAIGPICDNQNIGGYYSSTTPYHMSSHTSGVLFAEGTKSVIVFGEYGSGASCYGVGNSTGFAGGEARTTDVPNAEILQWMNDNETDSYPCGDGTATRAYIEGTQHQCCYDPKKSSPGSHAYPYILYAWAYDADDLVRVKEGGRIVDDPSPNLVTEIVESGATLRPGISPTSTDTYKPYHIKPYAMWEVPQQYNRSALYQFSGSVAYDESSKIMYFPMTNSVDANKPIISAYRLNIDSNTTKYKFGSSIISAVTNE
jgi:hypothetical protein